MTGRRPAHPRTPRRGPRPTRAAKHTFVIDRTVPQDLAGRDYCERCGCAGQPGDQRHYSTDEAANRAADQRQLDARKLGEKE